MSTAKLNALITSYLSIENVRLKKLKTSCLSSSKAKRVKQKDLLMILTTTNRSCKF